MALFGKNKNIESAPSKKPEPPKQYLSGRELKSSVRGPSVFVPEARGLLTEAERGKILEKHLGRRAMDFGVKTTEIEKALKKLREKDLPSAKTWQKKQEIQKDIYVLKRAGQSR